jgi:ABC-type lipoprotein release transport system permease subunit
MSAATLWARSEIRRGWGSLLVVALLIAITGGAVMAGVAGARRAGDSVNRYLADVGLSDVTIFTQGAPLDATILKQVTNDPRVKRTAVMQVVLATPSTLRPGQDGSTIVMPPEYWGGAVRPRLLRGRYPSASDEIAMTEQMAAFGFEVGQNVDMVVLSPEGLSSCIDTGACDPDPAGSARITGALRLPSDLAPGPFDQGLFLAASSFLDTRGGDATAIGFITDLFTADGASADGIVADYSTAITNGDIGRTDSDVDAATDAAKLQHEALLIGAAIAGLAGLLIVGQAYGRFLTRRTSDAMTLSALGMSRNARTTAAWLPGLAAGAGGAMGAVPTAIALSPLFPLQMARRADPDVGFHTDAAVLIVGVVIVILIVATTAWISARWWSRTTVTTRPTSDVSPVTKLALDLRLAPAPMVGSGFALERGRGPRRAPVVPALAGAIGAVAVVVGALVMSSSLDGLLSSPQRYGANWDLQVSAGDQVESVAPRIAADDRVDATAVAVTGELDLSPIGGQPIQEYAIGFEQTSGSIDPVILDGRPIRSPDELLLGSRTLDNLGAHVGDKVAVGGPGGQRTMTVVGRVIVPIVGSASTDTGAVVPLRAFRELGGDQTVADVDSETQIFVRTTEGESVRRDLEAAGAGVDGTFRQSNVSILDEIRGVPFYVATFTALIGALAVFHALAVTGRRRRRDLAVLRALGHRPGQTRQVIRWQAFVLTTVALVVGVPLGIIGGRLIWQSIAGRADVLVVIDTPLPAVAAVAGSALIGAIAVLATGPAIAAGRRPPSVDLMTE